MSTGYRLLDQPNPNYKQYRETRRTTNHGGRLTGAIVLHDAEGGTDLTGEDTGAENVARYICTRTTPGSYHRLVDRDSTIPMAPYEYEVWHDTTSNNYAIGLCVAWNKADLPRLTRAQRESYYVPFAHAVLHAVAWLKRYRGITVPLGGFTSRADIVAGKAGITTHSRMDPSRRSDPFGTGSPYEAEFLAVLATLAGNTTAPNLAADVREIQTRLSELGYYAGRIDGDYGPMTREAVAKYQTDQGLLADGEWGPVTETHYQEETAMPSVSEIVAAVWGAHVRRTGKPDTHSALQDLADGTTAALQANAKADAILTAVKNIPGVDAEALAAEVAARVASIDAAEVAGHLTVTKRES